MIIQPAYALDTGAKVPLLYTQSPFFCVETIFLYSTVSHQTQRNTDIDIYRTNFAERLGQRYQFFAVLVVFVRRKANPSQSFKLLLI